MIKAIFRLTESDKQRIFKLRELGVSPTDIARRFGISTAVVCKIIHTQRQTAHRGLENHKAS